MRDSKSKQQPQEAGRSAPAPQTDLNGERIRVLWLLNVVVGLTVLVLCWLAWCTYSSNKYLHEGDPTISRILLLNGDIRYYDEALTMSARMAAATGNPAWETRYWKLDPKLTIALDELRSLAPSVSSGDATELTDAANEVLIGLENRAFELSRNGEREQALALLLSNEYGAQKLAYAAGMDQLHRELQRFTNKEEGRQHVQTEWSLAAVLVLSPLLLVFWWLMVRAARHWHTTIEERTTSLIEANNELLIAMEIANEANRAKGQFLSQMSHELRTPMNAILGFGQFLGDTNLNEGQRRDLDQILASGRHLVGLVDELLEAGDNAA